jgi:hypothetical protein
MLEAAAVGHLSIDIERGTNVGRKPTLSSWDYLYSSYYFVIRHKLFHVLGKGSRDFPVVIFLGTLDRACNEWAEKVAI